MNSSLICAQYAGSEISLENYNKWMDDWNKWIIMKLVSTSTSQAIIRTIPISDSDFDDSTIDLFGEIAGFSNFELIYFYSVFGDWSQITWLVRTYLISWRRKIVTILFKSLPAHPIIYFHCKVAASCSWCVYIS